MGSVLDSIRSVQESIERIAKQTGTEHLFGDIGYVLGLDDKDKGKNKSTEETQKVDTANTSDVSVDKPNTTESKSVADTIREILARVDKIALESGTEHLFENLDVILGVKREEKGENEQKDKKFIYFVNNTGKLLQTKISANSFITYQRQNNTTFNLEFHDQALDENIISKKNIGDKVLHIISDGNINAMMKFSDILDKTGTKPTSTVALQSRGGTMDFALHYLHATFDNGRKTFEKQPRMGEYDFWDNLSGFIYFSGVGQKAFNCHDAGNFLWGHAMAILGYSLEETLSYANKNEAGDDSNADQRAIKQGFLYKTKTSKILPGDLKVNDDDIYDANANKFTTPVNLEIAFQRREIDYDK